MGLSHLLGLRAARACGEEEGKWGAVGCWVLRQDPGFLTTHCPPLATGGASEGEEPRRAERGQANHGMRGCEGAKRW